MKKGKMCQPEGNYYNKYDSKNLIEKKLMSGFYLSLKDLLKTVKLRGGGIFWKRDVEKGILQSILQNIIRQRLLRHLIFLQK